MRDHCYILFEIELFLFQVSGNLFGEGKKVSLLGQG